MTPEHERIPTVEVYRGVGIHDEQPRRRIEGVVKPAIDQVMGMVDPKGLTAYAADSANPPEARLLAAARLEAIWEMAADSREVRPNVDMAQVRASVAGLNSAKWRHPHYYGSLLDRRYPPGQRRQVMREINNGKGNPLPQS